MSAAIAAVAAISLGCTALFADGRPHPTSAAPTTPNPQCPRDLTEDIATIDEAIAAARRLLAGRENAWIKQIVSLAPGYFERPGEAELRAIATSKCGFATASRSWAIFVAPRPSTAPQEDELVFVVKTASGLRRYQ